MRALCLLDGPPLSPESLEGHLDHPQFSPDGWRVAPVARNGTKWLAWASRRLISPVSSVALTLCPSALGREMRRGGTYRRPRNVPSSLVLEAARLTGRGEGKAALAAEAATCAVLSMAPRALHVGPPNEPGWGRSDRDGRAYSDPRGGSRRLAVPLGPTPSLAHHGRRSALSTVRTTCSSTPIISRR